ncbi:hypothetical protein Pelo_13163 [Pelomyxa schiedti]|nr:hypothetical protein Pelo_13163 [Pelomyxa schiedti]
MPFVEYTVPIRFQLYLDKSVDSEVIVVLSPHNSYSGNRADIFVVDMEQTYNTKSLTILSTTTCMFPEHIFESLVVLRNWLPRSPDYGSRSFFVNAVVADGVSYRRNKKMCRNELFHVEESTGTLTHMVSHMVDVFRVCDSLLGGMLFKSHKGKKVRRFYIDSGFMLNVFGNLIDVIEPTTGFLVLSITFPCFHFIHHLTHFSCFFSN